MVSYDARGERGRHTLTMSSDAVPSNLPYAMCIFFAMYYYTVRAENAKRGRLQFSLLEEMSLSILDLLPVLAGTNDQQIAWFQQRGLLASNDNCPSCGLQMQLQTRNDIQDKCR